MADPVETKKSVWSNPFNIALLIYYSLMTVVGLCIPDDVLKANAWAKEFSDFMASIVPQISRITALGIKPEVNRFYFSVLWAGSPVMFAICIGAIWSSRNSPNARMWTMPLTQSIGWMTFLLVVIVGAQYGYWMTDSTNRQLRFLLSNTFGRSFWGSLVYVHGSSIFGSMLALWLYGWLTNYIPRNIERQCHG
jgi:hypothetical protein